MRCSERLFLSVYYMNTKSPMNLIVDFFERSVLSRDGSGDGGGVKVSVPSTADAKSISTLNKVRKGVL